MLRKRLLTGSGRLSAFVSHGGMASVLEAAYSGTPVVAVGIFGDQMRNAAMLARHGGAVVFEKKNLVDSMKFTAAVESVLEDPTWLLSLDENFSATKRRLEDWHFACVVVLFPLENFCAEIWLFLRNTALYMS